ncbi:MAG: PAS domain S-box protein [Terriglobales bacterium]
MTRESNTAQLPGEQFRRLVDAVLDYAIFLLDPQGNVVSWNSGAQRIKGYSPEEIIGRHFSCFHTPEDRKRGVPEKALQVAASEGRLEMETWRLRKDGSRFWANVVITALRNPDGQLTGFAKITRDLTERKQAEEALHELSGRLMRVQDEERKRIGRDLHDSVGQHLILLKIRLDQLEATFQSDEPTRRKMAECIELLMEAVQEVRTTSYELYPPMLEEVGLKSAIPWYLDGYIERSGIATTLDISCDPERPPHEVERAVFRTMLESLTNVRKHSGSAQANISLHIKDGTVRLEIRDQGKGIPPEIQEAFKRQQYGKLGVGLTGMRERVRQLGGELEVSSNGQGTVVRCTIPYSTSA